MSNSYVTYFKSPGTSHPLAGTFFKIGIGNPDPHPPIEKEGSQAAKYLRSSINAQIVGGSARIGSFLGAPRADIEFRYFNGEYSLYRHGIERIWIYDGNEMMIEASGPAASWAATRTLFDYIISKAADQ